MSVAEPPPDPWAALGRHTTARIALGRAGGSLPTHAWLAFAAAHAAARDAVHRPLDAVRLADELAAEGWPSRFAESAAPDRVTYLRRPDLGRRLSDASAAALSAAAARSTEAGLAPPDLVIVVGDGLSSLGVQQHVPPLLRRLRGLGFEPSAAERAQGEPASAARPVDSTVGCTPAAARVEAEADAPACPALRVAPVVIATQARVALGDGIGARLGAAAVLVLIGERPGLSSPDSVGAYLTFAPREGAPDSARNCVSNIRPDGLPPALAAARLAWLVREALRRRVTGIALKDRSAEALPGPGAEAP